MKSSSHIYVLIIVLLFLLSACAPKNDFDIRGEWKYTMIVANGNTYDTSTITFSGRPTKGYISKSTFIK